MIFYQLHYFFILFMLSVNVNKTDQIIYFSYFELFTNTQDIVVFLIVLRIKENCFLHLFFVFVQFLLFFLKSFHLYTVISLNESFSQFSHQVYFQNFFIICYCCCRYIIFIFYIIQNFIVVNKSSIFFVRIFSYYSNIFYFVTLFLTYFLISYYELFIYSQKEEIITYYIK